MINTEKEARKAIGEVAEWLRKGAPGIRSTREEIRTGWNDSSVPIITPAFSDEMRPTVARDFCFELLIAAEAEGNAGCLLCGG